MKTSIIALTLTGAIALATAAFTPASAQAQSTVDPMMAFQQGLDRYLDLRERASGDVVREIDGRALAVRIRTMRPDAAPADVFSAPMSALIRDRLHRGFDPYEVDAMLSKLYDEGLPQRGAVRLNHGCASGVLVAPPVGVLAALPPLPGILGYRLAGRDLILWDEEAAMVVDVVRDALPESQVWDSPPGFRAMIVGVDGVSDGPYGDRNVHDITTSPHPGGGAENSRSRTRSDDRGFVSGERSSVYQPQP